MKSVKALLLEMKLTDYLVHYICPCFF